MQSIDTTLRRMIDDKSITGAEAYKHARNKSAFEQFREDNTASKPQIKPAFQANQYDNQMAWNWNTLRIFTSYVQPGVKRHNPSNNKSTSDTDTQVTMKWNDHYGR